MGKGTKAGARSFDDTSVKVGKVSVRDGGSTGAKAPKAPKGVDAGGTENIAADGRSLSRSHSLPSKPATKDSWPEGLHRCDGTYAPSGVKEPK